MYLQLTRRTHLSPQRSHLERNIIIAIGRLEHSRQIRNSHVTGRQRKCRECVGNQNTQKGHNNSATDEILGKGNRFMGFFIVFGSEEGQDHEGQASHKDPR